jgi:hypothetical protein
MISLTKKKRDCCLVSSAERARPRRPARLRLRLLSPTRSTRERLLIRAERRWSSARVIEALAAVEAPSLTASHRTFQDIDRTILF